MIEISFIVVLIVILIVTNLIWYKKYTHEIDENNKNTKRCNIIMDNLEDETLELRKELTCTKDEIEALKQQYENSAKIPVASVVNSLQNIIKDVNEHTKANRIKKNISSYIKQLTERK